VLKNRPSTVTRGGRKSGHTSAAMTKRIARMAENDDDAAEHHRARGEAIEENPPVVRARLTTSERAGVPGPALGSVSG